MTLRKLFHIKQDHEKGLHSVSCGMRVCDKVDMEGSDVCTCPPKFMYRKASFQCSSVGRKGLCWQDFTSSWHELPSSGKKEPQWRKRLCRIDL